MVTQPAPALGVNWPLNAGELTWQLTHVIGEYRRLHGDRFQTFADIVGALAQATDEFQRRVIHPYEDGKRILNGDAYAPVARIRNVPDEAQVRTYLAGPMTGIPAFNFPAFDRAAVALRAQGHDVVSPAELDSPAHRVAALASPDGSPQAYNSKTGETWGDLLARDVKLIADDGIEEIRVLKGWARSRGARLETFVARALCGVPVSRLDGRRIPLWRLTIAWAVGR